MVKPDSVEASHFGFPWNGVPLRGSNNNSSRPIQCNISLRGGIERNTSSGNNFNPAAAQR